MLLRHTVYPALVGLSVLMFTSTLTPCAAKNIEQATWNKWVKISGLDQDISNLMVRYRSLNDAEKQAAIKTTLQDIRDAKKALMYNEGDEELQKNLAKEQVILSILTYRVPGEALAGADNIANTPPQNNWNDLLKQARWDARTEFVASMNRDFQSKPADIKNTLLENTQEHLKKIAAQMGVEKNKNKRTVLRKEMARDKIKLIMLTGQSPKI